MAALDFPASPTVNDIYSSGGRSWQWDGTSWNSVTPTSLTNVTGTLAVANGGTGAVDATNARSNLGLAIGTNVQAYDAGLASIAGLTTSADQGIYTTAADTYATFSLTSAGRALLDDVDAAAQRTTLGLGSIATQAASSVSITGGSITGITDLAVADGGTGASTAADARVNLLPSYTGNGSKVLSLNSGATDVEWATPSGGGGTTYVVKTANYTMADLEGVLANTSAGSFTVTLPATPTVGSQCIIADDADTFGTNNLTVGRNGSTIEGTAADLVLDISGVSVQFVYSGSTWNVYAQIGGNGGTAVTLDGVQTITNKTFTTGNAFNGTLGATTPSTVAATTLSASGASSFPNSAPSVIGGLGFRNRIINGDMRIDQRNEGAAVTVNTGNTTFSTDRFLGNGMASAGVFSLQRSTTAPAGFTNSLLVSVTTADASVAAADRYFLSHNIEGLNCSDLGFGTASAKTVTLSFWVRSSVTGTFSGSLANSAYNRAYPFTYTINAADTFEYKTITIPGDTSGTWLTTNGIGIRIYIDLGGGANFRTTAGSWANAGYVGATGAVNLISTASATWYLTGVQLEVGNAATEFERRPFGQELALCQRYFKVWRSSSAFQFLANGSLSSSTQADIIMPLPVTMRSAPVVTTSGTFRVYTTGSINISAFGTLSGFVDNIYLAGTISGGTGGHACLFGDQGSNDAVINASAEL